MEEGKGNNDGTVSLGDILASYDALDAEADAIMSDLSDDWGSEGVCTFDRGYYEQPVYTCLTCQALHPGVEFGFCFGCSMQCHVDHDVIELFRKRHFKCDCSTTKLHEGCCQLRTRYDDINDENVYGHNFQGKYCYCDGSYNINEDIMLQCFVCFDWFHDRCIKEKLVGPFLDDGDTVFVCRTCSGRYEFLRKYPELFAKEEVIVDSLLNPKLVSDSPNIVPSTSSANNLPSGPIQSLPNAAQKNQVECKITNRKVEREAGVMFMVFGFEKELCRCQKCLDHYYLKDVSYLVEEEKVPPLPAPSSAPTLTAGPPHRLETGFSATGLSDREAMEHAAVQIEVAHRTAEFKRKFTELVAEAAREGRAFSLDDVERLKRDLGITIPPSNSSNSSNSSSNPGSEEPPNKKRRFE